jgi:hypothetical protein
VILNYIAVFKALGGGWQHRTDSDVVPEEIRMQMQQRTDWGNLMNRRNEETPANKEDTGIWAKPEW